MVHHIDDLWLFAAASENISGTYRSGVQHPDRSVNGFGQTAPSVADPGCSFVVADWREGGEPFCGAPTAAGSAYCAHHQPLCVVAQGSAEGRSRIAALMAEIEAAPEPPPELAHLKESALPESLPDEVGDLRALLDHPPPDARTEPPD